MKEAERKDVSKVADRLRGLCSRREYCSSDVMKKAMNALGGDRDEAMKVVDVLVKEKYVDDGRFAAAYARDKASIAGWGETKIRFMLASKGLSKQVIDSALSDIDEVRASERLDKLVGNKARSLAGDPQKKLKLLRYAMGRGYGYDEVRHALDRLNEDFD